MGLRSLLSGRAVMLTALSALVLTTCSLPVATLAQREAPGGVESSLAQTVAEPADWITNQQSGLRAPSLPSRSVDPPGRPTPPPTPTPAPVFDPVTVVQPKVFVDALPMGPRDVVAEASAVPGVSFATEVLIGEVDLAVRAGPAPVKVAAVDPAGFRVLTPQVTADAVEVWQRIFEGDAAFIHEVGHRLELPLGSRVRVGRSGQLRVGAYASNGVPPVADAIVTRETAAELGIRGRRTLFIALAPDADAEDVSSRVAEALSAPTAVIEDPRPRRAFLTGADARRAFEAFSYIDHGDGMISIDPGWVRRNIVRAKVPIFRGEVLCHRLMIDQLRGALQEIVDRGLTHLIDPTDYGGCWVPRHIDFNPRKPLSMHAWGIAVDFNVRTNGLGKVPQMDPRIVEVFDRWGFVWGGRWRRPDGMHFELGALMQSTGG